MLWSLRAFAHETEPLAPASPGRHTRTLSLPQPFAHLVACGAKRYEARAWGSPWRGPIAIHASAAPPSFATEAYGASNPLLGRRYADQGWSHRGHFLALPRSAVVGTARLVDVTRRGSLRGKVADDELCPPAIEVLDDDFIWIFDDAVQIQAIAGVPGKQRLWTLPPQVVLAVADAERNARAAGGGGPVDPARRTRSLARWIARQEEGKLAEKRRALERDEALRTAAVAQQQAEIAARRAREEAEIRERGERFGDPEFERHFKEVLASYLDVHPVRPNPQGVPSVRLVGLLQRQFRGRKWLPLSEFEPAMRRLLRDKAHAEMATDRPDDIIRVEVLDEFAEADEDADRQFDFDPLGYRITKKP